MVNLKWNQVVSLNWNWVVNITGISTFSYKLTAEKLHIPETTIYIQGHNLWTLSPYKNGDPEQSLSFLPPLRKLTFGFKLNF